MGLWILQECKRKWDQDGEAYSFAELVQLADQAEPLYALIDPDDLRFMNPADMPEEIRAYCRETGQPVPDSPGAFARCILESLALRYRQVLEQAEELTGSRFAGLHMVGGGIQNELLCRFTAEAIGRPGLGRAGGSQRHRQPAGTAADRRLAQGPAGRPRAGEGIVPAPGLRAGS
ncbi:hypothetical protein HMSSN139_14280 [Paenibacillus sp. HMSSN-139]|nr:hypothetical protein HMSSN139_14280 [Paenibacillus sp. HMSSN-139]